MYATGRSRCPVSIFKEYLARRRPEMAAADSPFIWRPLLSHHPISGSRNSLWEKIDARFIYEIHE